MLLIAGLGCGSGEVAGDAAPDDSHIKPLTMLYTSYMNRNGGPPANEADFKAYISQQGGEYLESLGVTADELFVSPRDNEPHVLLYGNEAAKLLNRGIITHERTGVGGRRLVGHRAGFVNEVDETEFRKLVPPS
jgi:hypothetical protein